MVVPEMEAQESDLAWYHKIARHASVWGSEAPETETVTAAASSSGGGRTHQMDDDASRYLEQAVVLMRGETMRAADEELIQAEAREVDLLNLSAEDTALLEVNDGNSDVGMQRRAAVLFVAALQDSISRNADGRNSVMGITEHGEKRISLDKRNKMKVDADALRESMAAALPPLEGALAGLDLVAQGPEEHEENAPLSAPTRFDMPLDYFRRVSAFPSVGKYWKAPMQWCVNNKTNPIFTASVFPLHHSLAYKYGMHPAFLHPDSPMCMRTEVLVANVEGLSWEDLRVLKSTERRRVEQTNSMLALDDPNNALGFRQYLDKMAYAATGRYGDFLLVLKHGQANVDVCSKEHAQKMEEDLAHHACIPLETVLIICSRSFVSVARKFAQALRDRMAERSARLIERARRALLEEYKEQLAAAEVPDSHIIMGCARNEELYQELVEVEMMRMFPGLFGPYSRRTAPDGCWADISVQCVQETDENTTRLYDLSMIAFLKLLGELGTDYYFVRSTRHKKMETWDNLEALPRRTAMSRMDREGWKGAVERLDASVKRLNASSKHRYASVKNGNVHALVVTNDRILQRDLPIDVREAECASMECLLFFGSGRASYQPFFARRIGKKDSAPGSPGYLNCFGRLFSQVPPLDLRLTELLAFAILWSPAHRDYLLPGYMDARCVLLGEEGRSASERSGLQTDRQKSPDQDCHTPPPPIACSQLDLELASLRAREVEADLAPRMLVALADDDISDTE